MKLCQKNRIPRVFINTGIEYTSIVQFVRKMQKSDDRITIVNPSVNIKKTLEKEGYPFKSKEFSHVLAVYQRSGIMPTVNRYLNEKRGKFNCPNILRYQFEDGFNIKISEKCCLKLKKEPFKKWQKIHNKSIAITGMMASEGGLRESIESCIITDKKGNLMKFHPLLKTTNEWEDWYIKERDIQLCELYYSPYNFDRTGCKGCPFALGLKDQLEVMERLLPAERKQCEYLWEPVYAEYRRIGYRLKKNEQKKLF